jgi:hypothetical protein
MASNQDPTVPSAPSDDVDVETHLYGGAQQHAHLGLSGHTGDPPAPTNCSIRGFGMWCKESIASCDKLCACILPVPLFARCCHQPWVLLLPL